MLRMCRLNLGARRREHDAHGRGHGSLVATPASATWAHSTRRRGEETQMGRVRCSRRKSGLGLTILCRLCRHRRKSKRAVFRAGLDRELQDTGKRQIAYRLRTATSAPCSLSKLRMQFQLRHPDRLRLIDQLDAGRRIKWTTPAKLAPERSCVDCA